MTRKDNWMKWRRELMDSCGQCVGFRAKGLALPTVEEGHVCKPNDACPRHCPGFQIDFDEIAAEIAVPREEVNIPAAVPMVMEVPETTPEEATVSCVKCGRSENNGVLLPCRTNGKNQWICTKCLPSLIHG